MKTKYILILAILAFMASCKPDIDEFEPSSGNADFTSYVAVGNSLTAGYADGALYKSGQEYGWANLLAQQLKKVGMQGEFKIPYMPDDNGVGFRGTHPVTKLILGYSTDCLGNTSLGPVLADPGADPSVLMANLMKSVADQGPFNNIGVPGIKVGHLLFPGLGNPALGPGNFNPYYTRFALHPATDVLIDEAEKVDPTFFSLWIGNNDVLGYATSGGVEDSITNPLLFEGLFKAVVAKLTSLTSKGVVANIPTITAIPFLNTVPYNPIPLTDSLAGLLNDGYLIYNQMMEALGKDYRIEWHEGMNPMVIEDKYMDLPAGFEQFKFRQIKEGELVTLTVPQDSIKCARWGTVKPIPDKYVLTETEIAKVDEAITTYNAIIKQVAEDNDLAYVDMAAALEKAKEGIVIDGVEFNTKYITGNIFSTDGVHLTPQGNAFVANLFIDAINKKYGSKIPKVVVSEYPTIQFPD